MSTLGFASMSFSVAADLAVAPLLEEGAAAVELFDGALALMAPVIGALLGPGGAGRGDAGGTGGRNALSAGGGAGGAGGLNGPAAGGGVVPFWPVDIGVASLSSAAARSYVLIVQPCLARIHAA